MPRLFTTSALLFPLLGIGCAQPHPAPTLRSEAAARPATGTTGAAGGPSSVALVELVGEAAEPIRSTGVLIIGSGAAGSAAALEAMESGADVIVVELADKLGGNGGSAGQHFAVGSRWQAESRVEDSPEIAAAEWSSFTGGEGEDENVRAFLDGSAETIEWIEAHGAIINSFVSPDPANGSRSRIHGVFYEPGTYLADQVGEGLGEDALTATRATSLVLDGDRVVGALVEGPAGSGWIEAEAVVVASGGFARNDALMVAARPALGELTFVYEASALSNGSGANLVQEAGGSTQNLGNYGMYIHSAMDPRRAGGRESVLMQGTAFGLFVNPEGERLGDEGYYGTFEDADALLDAGFDHAWALIPAAAFSGLLGIVPGYNWTDPHVAESYDAATLLSLGVVTEYGSIEAFAEGRDVPLAAMQDTFDRYDALVELGLDDDFGKNPDLLVPFGDGPVYAIELRPGAAKAFGGALTDSHMRALNRDGSVIPGLYVAGEAAGFLGTPSIGWGFSGSVSACLWGGRVAGGFAAAE